MQRSNINITQRKRVDPKNEKASQSPFRLSWGFGRESAWIDGKQAFAKPGEVPWINYPGSHDILTAFKARHSCFAHDQVSAAIRRALFRHQLYRTPAEQEPGKRSDDHGFRWKALVHQGSSSTLQGRANQSTDYQCIRPLDDSADTLFICLFRNPFDWLRSLHSRPYHAVNHMGLIFAEFLRKPWHSFETSRLNPCWPDRGDQYWFIEEAKNILRLRTEKIQHLLKLQDRVANVCYVNYEALRDDHELIGKMAHRFSIRLKQPYILVEQKHFGKSGNIEYSRRKRSPISADDLEFIRRELNWEAEGRIGYNSEDYQG